MPSVKFWTCPCGKSYRAISDGLPDGPSSTLICLQCKNGITVSGTITEYFVETDDGKWKPARQVEKSKSQSSGTS